MTVQEFIIECNRQGTSAEAIETAEKVGVLSEYKLEHPLIKGKKLPFQNLKERSVKPGQVELKAQISPLKYIFRKNPT